MFRLFPLSFVALVLGVFVGACAENTSTDPRRVARPPAREPRADAEHPGVQASLLASIDDPAGGAGPTIASRARSANRREPAEPRASRPRGRQGKALNGPAERPGGYLPAFDGLGLIDSDAYVYIETGRQYYYDGPNGPGYYDQSRWYTWYIGREREAQLFELNSLGLQEGMEHFRAGRYERAAVAWMGAARANETDAASRVHAAHALFAVGRYDVAEKMLARAFELAPRLATSHYDIRRDYGKPKDFNGHWDRLKAYVARNPTDAKAVTMLGYVLFYTTGPASAHRALERAAQLDDADGFIARLLEISRAVSPQGDTPRSKKAARRQPAPGGRR